MNIMLIYLIVNGSKKIVFILSDKPPKKESFLRRVPNKYTLLFQSKLDNKVKNYGKLPEKEIQSVGFQK